MAGKDGDAPADADSLYPPRRDAIRLCRPTHDRDSCMARVTAPAAARPPRRRDAVRRSRARGDARHRRGHDGDAAGRRRAGGDVLRAVDWPAGDYVAWIEINTEGDYNATSTTPPTRPRGSAVGRLGDGYRLSVSRSAVGRVQRAVHARRRPGWPPRSNPSAMAPSTGGSDAAHDARDGRHDHRRSAASARQRCRPTALSPGAHSFAWRSRFGMETIARTRAARPARRAGRRAGRRFRNTLMSGRAFAYNVPPSGLPHRQIRSALQRRPRSSPAIPQSFIRGLPALAASEAMEALMVPVSGPAGQRGRGRFRRARPVDALLGRHSRGRRVQPARAARGRRGHHHARSTTPSCSGPCFIATAAWGSALEPTVAAMRRARTAAGGGPAVRGRRRPLRPLGAGRGRGPRSAATPPGCSPASFWAPWPRPPRPWSPRSRASVPPQLRR